MSASGVVISVNNVAKRFAARGAAREALVVLDGFSHTFRAGELCGLYGPNGAGKSTLLRIISGLETPDSGAVEFPTGARDAISFVWQNFGESLLPWLRIADNISFRLRLAGASRNAIRDHAASTLKALAFEVPLDRYPHQLSGGQRQMAAIARAAASDPKVMLLDEPFSALDYRRRRAGLFNTQAYVREHGICGVVVSHDLDELVMFCDRILVLSPPPMRVLREIEVRLPHPRNEDQLFEPLFAETRVQALEAARAWSAG